MQLTSGRNALPPFGVILDKPLEGVFVIVKVVYYRLALLNRRFDIFHAAGREPAAFLAGYSGFLLLGFPLLHILDRFDGFCLLSVVLTAKNAPFQRQACRCKPSVCSRATPLLNLT